MNGELGGSSFEREIDQKVKEAFAYCQDILRGMDISQLQKFLDDQSKVEEFVNELPHIKELLSEKGRLLSENRELAERNLHHEPDVQAAKEELLQAIDDTEAVKITFAELRAQYDSLCQTRSLDTLLILMQTAHAEAEEETEKLRNEFLNSGAMSLEEFLEKVHKVRAQAHMRRMKVEKMRELLNMNISSPEPRDVPIQPLMARGMPIPLPERKTSASSNHKPVRAPPPPPRDQSGAAPVPPPYVLPYGRPESYGYGYPMTM